ncbi:MAG: L,D-transpeptidase Cds6 family protein [Panacagrimonas sp.]
MLGLFLIAQARPLAAMTRPPLRPLPEEQLVEAIELARLGEPRQSLVALEKLIAAQPNFRLAQLFYAHLLAARSGRPGVLRSHADDPQIRELLAEAQLRLDQARFTPPEGSVPSAVLQLSPEYPYLVLVDLPRSRLHLMQNVDGRLELVGSRYAAIGRGGFGKELEGDLRTPVGVYHVTGWMGDPELPELYGTGALPLNYPNLWDQHQSKTGFGIWLHGVPRQTYARGPRSSEGCVTMANDDLLWLKPFVVGSRAPVVLADQLQWVPQRKVREERDAILDRIEDWRRAWASRDSDALLSFYRDETTAAGLSKTQFTPPRPQKLVSLRKTAANIDLSDVSVFRYPGEPMLLAEFTVKYHDVDYRFTARKEQYWRKDAGGQWRIFREENR